MNPSLSLPWSVGRRMSLLALALAASLVPAVRAATITVNSASDPSGFNAAITVSTLGGTVTLRDAVNAANNTAGDDTIVFHASLAGQTITLGQIQNTSAGNTGLPISSGITLNGLGGNSGITISGGSTLRPFLVLAGATFTVTDLTLANGSSDRGGAIRSAGTLTVRRCTLRNNFGNTRGGAVYIVGGTGLLENCTLTANSAQNGGGAIVDTGSTLTLTHCTVRNNARGSGGGGGGAACFSGTLNLQNTIVAGNHIGLPSFPDDLFNLSGTVTGSYNLIGTGGAAGLANGVNGNLVGVADARVGSLAANGGPTETMALLTGSPALNAGSSSVTTDQRGTARPNGSAPDIGAYEVVVSPLSITSAASTSFPIDQLTTFTVTVAGSPPPTITVQGTLPTGVTHNGSGVLSGTPPPSAAGSYPLTITASNGFTPDAIQSFTLTVAEVPSLVVTTLADVVNASDGVTSLREAINHAQSLGGARTVSFSPALAAGGPVTLNLTQDGHSDSNGASAFLITGNVTVQGPTGTHGVVLSAADARRHFIVADTGSLTLSHLTLRDGWGTFGGAVWSFGSLTLRQCTFTANHATMEGGALQAWGDSPLLDVRNCTFHANTTDGLGAVMNIGAASMGFRHVTITGNPGSSVAVSVWKNPLTLINSIIAGNGTEGIGSANGGSLSAASANNLLGAGAAPGLVNGANGNVIGVSAASLNLGPLSKHGGPTPTIPLQAGSVAINAGTPAGAEGADQRGRTRDAQPDVGAYEYRRLLVTTAADPAGFDPALTLSTLGATVTLRDAIAASGNSENPPPVEFDPSLAGQEIGLVQVGDASAGNSALRVTGPVSVVAPAGGITITRSASAPAMRLFRVEAAGQLTMAGVILKGGNAGDGGAIYNLGAVTLGSCTVRENNVGGQTRGAGIFNGGTGSVSAELCLFLGNQCEETGGAIHNESTNPAGVSLNRCSFRNCFSIGYVLGGNTYRAGGGGGAIFNNGFLSVSGCEFGGCEANMVGGAILNEASGQAVVTQSYFELNETFGPIENSGGAIRNLGSLQVSRSTFSGNQAPINRGGAISTFGASGNADVRNCTFEGNVALFGQAVDAAAGGFMTLRHCTLAYNGGGTLGVVSVGTGSEVQVRHSILWNPAANSEFLRYGTLVDEGNLVRGVSPDPLLYPINYVGGPLVGSGSGYQIRQFALQASSPAIDAAPIDPAIALDQRGVARPQGTASDIGAFEFPGPGLDTDGDTLPDAWEYTYLDTLINGAAEDTDGDEFNNATEWMAGSNPRTHLSIPGPTHVARVYGFGPGRGLDLTGNFAYAFNVGTPGAAGQAGDADFTADNAPGITVSASNEIANWTLREFGNSAADNVLETVYRSIRWSDNALPDPEPRKVKVDLANLVPGWRYKLQLLFAEAGDYNRRFDVLVQGALVVDDFNPSSGQGIPASAAAAAAIVHEFVASGDTVSIVLDGSSVPGGTVDRNPILNGVTLESLQAAPTAGPDTVERPVTTRVVKVLKSDLLADDLDPDGDPLSITAVGDALPAGATVTISGNFVVYTAPSATAGNGSFTYTLSDGIGGHTVLGTVTVTETGSDASASAPNSVAITTVGSDVQVKFIGVPGRTYGVQYTTSSSPPYVWQEFPVPVDLVAPPSGVLSHTDVNPVDPMRLYRAILRH